MTKEVKSFESLVEKSFEELDLFTTAITRAHGKSHPEAFEVRELFETINLKIKESEPNRPHLDDEFNKLRNITKDYTVPNDVCETYRSTYEMLQTLDKLYHHQ